MRVIKKTKENNQLKQKKTNIPSPVLPPIPPPPNNMTKTNPTQSNSPFVDSIIQGFGFGFGSSIARNTVDKVFNSMGQKDESIKQINKIPELKKELKQENDICSYLYKDYSECIESSKHTFENNTNCLYLYNDYSKCIENQVNK